MYPDSKLEEILRVLIERFGSRATLSEVYALTCGLRMVREGRQPTVGEIAGHTGISKQNISRWVGRLVSEGYVSLERDQTDQRQLHIRVNDLESASRHLNEVSPLLQENDR